MHRLLITLSDDTSNDFKVPHLEAIKPYLEKRYTAQQLATAKIVIQETYGKADSPWIPLDEYRAKTNQQAEQVPSHSLSPAPAAFGIDNDFEQLEKSFRRQYGQLEVRHKEVTAHRDSLQKECEGLHAQLSAVVGEKDALRGQLEIIAGERNALHDRLTSSNAAIEASAALLPPPPVT